MAERKKKVCVLGAGLWGTVLAQRLASNGYPVALWEFFPDAARSLQLSRKHPFLPELRLHPGIEAVADLAYAVSGCRILLVGLPSAHVRHTVGKLRPLLDLPSARLPIVVNAAKGIEPSSLKTMCEVIEEEVPALKGRVFGFSGPSFAREVARGVPTKILLAGPAGQLAREAMAALNVAPILVEHESDRKGVELGGGLKNVLAIGCGIVDGLGAGANTKAALITQGVQEMGELLAGNGGRFETIYGLAGLGDLFATGTSPESRNRALGEKLGRGQSLQHALEIRTVVEGVESSRSAYRLCRTGRVKSPLLDSVWKVVHNGEPPSRVLSAIGFS